MRVSLPGEATNQPLNNADGPTGPVGSPGACPGLSAKIYTQQVKAEVVTGGRAEEFAFDGVLDALVRPGRVEGEFA